VVSLLYNRGTMKLNVVVLAGGHSTRFFPLEEKNLFQFFDIPLIIYQLKRYLVYLRRLSFKPNFVVVTNELNHLLIKKELQKHGLTGITLVTQTLPDQSGAVISALKKIPNREPILIVNSNDIFSETLLSDLLKRIKGSRLIFTAKKVSSYFPGGYLVRNSHGKIERIWEKPESHLVPDKLNLFKFVFDFFESKEMLSGIFENKKESNLSYEDMLNILLQTTEPDLIINDQPFTSLKYPWHVLSAMEIFLSHIKESTVKTADIDSTAQIVGNVLISEGVKIGAFTRIVGPVFIGKNTVIGDCVLIRNSHIGQNSLIGAHSEVARSYLGNKVALHRNYIGDSVLSDGVSFGANALTANWRFDEQMIRSSIQEKRVETGLFKLGAVIGEGVKVGVSVALMPGVKIVKQVKIKPGQVILKDINHE